MDLESIIAIRALATELVAASRLPDEDEIAGVRALDVWVDGLNAGVLFWASADVDLHGKQEPELFAVRAQLTDGAWRARGGGGVGSVPLDQLGAGLPPGLHRLGGSAGRVSLTWAFATPDVAMIILRDDSGRVRERVPGRYGVALLGVTSEDPLTHAYGVDRAGEPCATKPLTLWAPPRGR